MGDDLDQLKTVFRSLVVSCPTQMDVRSLLRDYRNMIGAPVPITKYGYRNPVEFLQERFSDCFLFSGLPSNPVLTLIVPNSLKHIDKFVQKQKVSSSAKSNPKRRSVPETVVKSFRQCVTNDNPQSAYNSSSFKPNDKHTKCLETKNSPQDEAIKFKETTRTEANEQVNIRSKCNEGPSKSNNKFASTSVTNTKCTITKVPSNEYIDSIKCKKASNKHNGISSVTPPDTSMYKGTKDVPASNKLSSNKENINTDTPTQHISNDNAVKNFFRKRLPLYNSSLYLDEELRSPESLDDDSGKHTSSSNSSIKARQLEQLKDEILQLICDSTDGVWCTNLIGLYRERYNRELNYNRFGYTSIISLVYCLEDRILITRPEDTGDWLLQDRAQSCRTSHAFRPRRLRSSYTALQSSRQLDPDDALPGIDYDPDVFPEDCMHFMESIESVSLSDFRPGAMVEVMIGEVYSPSHFWFLRVGEDYNFAMEDMMDEMTRYYSGEGRERVLSRGAVRVGHYCSSLFESDWHRSLIVKVVDCDTVKVRHVDYGTVDSVPVSALRPLRREWAALPAQAARARLAAVRPAAGGWRWSRAACAAFLALVSNRRLVANVVATDPRDNVAEVLLIDTHGEQDVCIGRSLVRAGHADTRTDCTLTSCDAYLYPRFEALESGATPNYAEIHAYLRDGINIDYVDEYRAHVPTLPHHHHHHHHHHHDAASQPDLPTRIPLLLPERPAPPKSAPVLRASDEHERRARTEGRGRSSLSPPPFSQRSPPPFSQRSPPAPSERSPSPPSQLSPLAPSYVPRARPVAPSPPPPYVPPLPLSAAECDTYRMLARVNPEAAHWFILGALGHAVSSTHPAPPPPPGMPPLPSSFLANPLPPWLAYPPLYPPAPGFPPAVYPHQLPPAPAPFPYPMAMHPPHFVPPPLMHPVHAMRPPGAPPLYKAPPVPSSHHKPVPAAPVCSVSAPGGTNTSVTSSHSSSVHHSDVINAHLHQGIRPPPGFGF